MLRLPSDILRYICLNLKLQDIYSFGKTCKKVYKCVIMSKYFWNAKIKKDYSSRLPLKYDESNHEMYKLLSQKSKYINLTRDKDEYLYYYTTEDEINIEFNLDLEDEFDVADAINDYFDNIEHLPWPILKGDVFRLDWISGYRNNGKYIWDGTKAVALDYFPDDYGNIPRKFTFPEFPLDHFINTIDHNHYIWLSESSIKEAIQNYNPITKTSYVTDQFGDTFNIYVYENDVEFSFFEWDPINKIIIATGI